MTYAFSNQGCSQGSTRAFSHSLHPPSKICSLGDKNFISSQLQMNNGCDLSNSNESQNLLVLKHLISFTKIMWKSCLVLNEVFNIFYCTELLKIELNLRLYLKCFVILNQILNASYWIYVSCRPSFVFISRPTVFSTILLLLYGTHFLLIFVRFLTIILPPHLPLLYLLLFFT